MTNNYETATRHPEGLTEAEAARRLATCGPNRLPSPPRRGPLQRLLLQFHNVLIYVLLAAALIATAMGHGVDAAVIFAVVLVNAAIGFLQESRAESALEAIQAMVSPRATVLRDGRRRTLPAEEIVPGDVVLIEAGDIVPADIELIRARNLRIEEAVLTGESVAVEKKVGVVTADVPLGDRHWMAFSGTVVATGQGAGSVVATGGKTELGRIGSLISTVEPLKTPLLRQMDRFARGLTAVIIGVSAAVFAFAVLARGYDAADAFMIMVGLAVAAIPEGLPAVMTITLAIGVRRMAALNAIIRQLPAVETLGSVTVICSDKTGTLTANEMMVQAVVTAGRTMEVTGAGYEPRGTFREGGAEIDPTADAVLVELSRAAALCNDAVLRQAGPGWSADGDPMEGALVSLAIKAGHDVDLLRKQFPRSDEIPFDAAHRFMATLHHGHDGTAFIYIKGAPERLLAMCGSERRPDGDLPLDAAYWERATADLAAGGQRVLAIAVMPASPAQAQLSFAQFDQGAALLGLLGLSDPPRREALTALDDCRTAGIRVKMITGDHAVTARAIARQLGLAEEPIVMGGHELDALDDAALRQATKRTDVFARTTPEHKLRLVRALQAEGEIVAMTGDGVNDAPALRQADVGVAMGRKGTDAARKSAEMVLADDNFASIVAAIHEGRTVYENLKKVIAWTLPTNGGESLVIVIAILAGLMLPITAVQILWINLVTAVTLGLCLAFEPGEPGAMSRPPRPPAESLLPARLAWRIVFVSLLFVAGSFGIFQWALQRDLPIELARTMVVNTIVVMEIFYLFSVRYVHGTSLTWTGVLGTPAVLAGVGTVVLAQLAFTYWPFFQRVFDTRPIALPDGLAIVGVGVALLLVVETEKLAVRLLRPASAGRRS